MQRFSFALCLAAAAAVSACAGVGSRIASNCTPGVCNLTVKVSEACAVTVEPNDQYVYQSTNLRWHIADPANYKFATDGIVFADMSEFDDCHLPGIQDDKFYCQDLFTKSGQFKYAVNVIRKRDNQRCSQDPYIYNQ